MEKKIKWPKFLTIKRTILLALLLIVIIILLVYFLGGYKPTPKNNNVQSFTTDNFISYETMFKEQLEIVEQEAIAFQQKVNALNDDDAKITELIDQVITTNNAEVLKAKVNQVVTDTAKKRNYNETINALTTISDNDYASSKLNNYELLFKNNDYAFYFNKRYTTFRVDKIFNGDVTIVSNSWFSNPDVDWKDPNSAVTDPNSRGDKINVIYNQQSPIILNFLTRGGDIKKYNVYEYSIIDKIGSGADVEEVMPTFEIKVNEEDKSIQVYYNVSQKGISYRDFPKSLYLSKIEELKVRNANFVESQYELLESYEKENEINMLHDYVNAHRNVELITDYLNSTKTEPVGYHAALIYAACYMPSVIVNKDNYSSVIDSIYSNISELTKLAKIMVDVEYKFNYRSSDYFEEILGKDSPEYILACSKSKLYIKDKTYIEQFYSDKKTDITKNEEGEEVDNSYRTIDNYLQMKRNIKQGLKQLLYKRMSYTIDDLQEDLKAFDVEFVNTNIDCKIAIEYKLTDSGVKATILNNSIVETQPDVYPLYMVDILPYFTSSIDSLTIDGNKYQTSGGFVIPDGSGAYVKLNNGKTQYAQYSKRVYTTDLAFGSKTKKTASQDILLPMYGLVVDRIGPVGATKPSSMMVARVVTGAPQTNISANISQLTDSFNKIYFSTVFRESQLVQIGTGYYAKEITKFTENIVKTDTAIEYSLLSDNSNDYTYTSVAKHYQTLLLRDGIISKNSKDTTNETMLNAELLGIYDYRTHFLGIVYDGHDTLTDYTGAKTILSTLKDWGANNINVLYRGWRDGGLVKETFNDMTFGNKLGSKDELNDFIEYINSNNMTLYPVVSFLEINKYDDLFGKSRYSTRDVSSEYTEKYPYDLPSGVYSKTLDPYYTISPKFFKTFANILSENFHKKNPQLNSMAFDKLGSVIVGDYDKRNTYYKVDSVNSSLQAFEEINENISNLTLTAPYEFAVKYATNITNLPYESTLLDLFDYSIPLYQLIFSGYKDYSGMVINANDEIALNKHLMNILQTGSNVHFTFSFENSNKLIQTDYNYYYYTQYSQWEAEVSSVLNELNKYKIHEYTLDSHNPIKGSDRCFEVVYKHKENNSTFKIYLNFSDQSINVNINGSLKEIKSNTYFIDKEVN